MPAVLAGVGFTAQTPEPCQASVSKLSIGLGSPDRVAVIGKKVFFTEPALGSIGVIHHGQPVSVADNLKAPTGIIARSPGKLIVVQQDLDRLTQINLATHRRHKLLQLGHGATDLGLEGIQAAPAKGIYVPNTGSGSLQLLTAAGRLKTLAKHLGRPVDAVSFRGGVAVADETGDAVWLVKKGKARVLAHLQEPDGLAVFDGALIASTLGDAALWEVRPQRWRLLYPFGEPEGLAPYRKSSLLLADGTQNRIYRIDHLASCMKQ